MRFNIGDRVRLRSGGPAMTVECYTENEDSYVTVGVFCIWFQAEELKRGRFPEDALELVSN